MRKKTYLKLVDYQTEQSEKHLNEVRSIHKEMRGYKHDFHHHLQTLKGQLEAGEIERALAYIEQLDTQLMLVDTLLKTGNVSLDAILSAKIAQAKAEAITVTVKANVPDILTISDLELSIVIGNLLDNAIESYRHRRTIYSYFYFDERNNALFFYAQHSRSKEEKDRFFVCNPQGRCSRVRFAPCRSNP